MPFKSGKDWTGNREGRPTREREAAYLLVMKEVIDAKAFRVLCQEAYLEARGKKISYVVSSDGQSSRGIIIDDPDSTPLSRLANKRYITDYLAGKPIQQVITDEAQGELWERVKEMFSEMNDFDERELNSIIEDGNKVIEKFKNKCQGRGAASVKF